MSLLLGIKDIVDHAAIAAGSKADRYAVPFPGMGQQTRSHNEMTRILPLLPRCKAERKGAEGVGFESDAVFI